MPSWKPLLLMRAARSQLLLSTGRPRTRVAAKVRRTVAAAESSSHYRSCPRNTSPFVKTVLVRWRWQACHVWTLVIQHIGSVWFLRFCSQTQWHHALDKTFAQFREKHIWSYLHELTQQFWNDFFILAVQASMCFAKLLCHDSC